MAWIRCVAGGKVFHKSNNVPDRVTLCETTLPSNGELDIMERTPRKEPTCKKCLRLVSKGK